MTDSLLYSPYCTTIPQKIKGAECHEKHRGLYGPEGRGGVNPSWRARKNFDKKLLTSFFRFSFGTTCISFSMIGQKSLRRYGGGRSYGSISLAAPTAVSCGLPLAISPSRNRWAAMLSLNFSARCGLFAVHNDSRGHTSGVQTYKQRQQCTTFLGGFIANRSRKSIL